MRSMMHISLAAVAIASAIVLTGCEDSPLSAGKDYTMTLIAQPADVPVESTGPVTITATVLNKDSVPQQGITVYFSNKGGTLTPASGGVKTDSGGNASVKLAVRAGDSAEVDVTATSAALTETVKITRSTVPTPPVNHPPTAGIAASPQNEQASGKPVVFDGSASSDPDTGDFITMYKWVIFSTNPDDLRPNPYVAEGPGVSGVSFPSDVTGAFVNLQELTVQLLVTDDPNAPADFAAHIPIVYRAQQTIPYTISAVRCSDNTKPTAIISGAATQQIYGAPFATVSFLADGTLSTDPETPIETYTWNCGNGSIPLPQGNGSKAVCKYVVDQTPRTYTLTLVVTDQGTGVLRNGAYECAAESTTASIQVAVTPLAAP